MPVVTTALAVALALLPAILLGRVPGAEVLRPMAIVVLGGLVTATLVTLFVVPALYLRFAGRPPRSVPANGAEVITHPRESDESEAPDTEGSDTDTSETDRRDRPAYAG
jgi:predicted exporter